MIHKCRLWWLVLSVLLVLFTAPSYSQQHLSQRGANQSSSSRAREIQTKISEANRLLRSNPREALELLKKLHRRFPDEASILAYLGQAYRAVEEVDSAIVVFQKCLDKDYGNLVAAQALGILLLSRGEDGRAKEHFDRFLEYTKYAMPAYRVVGTSYSEVGLYDLALDIYRQGRARSDTHYKLTIPLADLEKAMGNLTAALSEYLNYIDRFPENFELVRKRILQLFDDTRTTENSEKVWSELLTQTEERALGSQNAQREILGILSVLYLRSGLLEKALDAALEADRSGRTGGQTLHSLAMGLRKGFFEQSLEQKRRYFDLCIRALETYIERYPRSYRTPHAAYLQASLYGEAARGRVPGFTGDGREQMFEKALEALDAIFLEYPESEEASLAVIKKGDLFFEVKKQPREALAVYKMGLGRSRTIPNTLVEKIGRMYLVLEEFALARRHFEQFIRSSHEGRRETGIYYLGVLFSFTGEYDAARDTLTSLAKENPASPYTNDAIELAWIIEEGRQRDEKKLDRFIDVLKAEMSRDTARVVENLESFNAEGPGAVLRERALFKLGEVYAQMGDYESALARLQSFLEDYPRHDLRPDVHRAVARIYEHGYGNTELALKEYENILVKYPHYLFLDEVRNDINRLKPRTE